MMKKVKIVLMSVILLMIFYNTAYAKWAYEFVVFNKNIYVITDKKVNCGLIGSVLGQVTSYSDREGTYSGNFSNTFPKGTKYYIIKGSDSNKVIAIKEKDGTFIEANYGGKYAGSRYNIQNLLLCFSGLIILLMIVVILVKKKLLKTK
jgi:hypothetical protein